MNYKVGDKVRIISHPERKCNPQCHTFNDEMTSMTGSVRRIINVQSTFYTLQDSGWSWNDCMLEKVITHKPKISNDQDICFECELVIAKDDSYNDPDGHSLCESCFDDLCFMCSDCNEVCWENERIAFSLGQYCHSCANQISFECEDCGDRFSLDECCGCDGCGSSYCQDCYDEDGCRDDDNEQEQDLTFTKGKKSSLITVDRFVGVELEAENGDDSDINLPSRFGVGGDGSLDETGVEVTTSPASGTALVEDIKLLCDQLNKAAFEPTDSCGLHIHIDLRDIKDDYLKLSRILRTFYAIEDTIFAMLPTSRRTGSWCYPLRDKFSFYDFYGNKVKKEFDATIYGTTNKSTIRDNKRCQRVSARYRSFNFHSVFYRGTLEIRAHQATQNPTKIINWIELLLKVVDWSINDFKHSTVESLLKTPNSELKVKRMRKIFKFSKKIETYINQRSKKFHQENLTLPFSWGELPKSKAGKK